MSKKFICSNCGYLGQPETIKKGSDFMEMILWWCFLLPGFIYSIWRLTTRYKVCPGCKAPYMVPLNSPRGSKQNCLGGERREEKKGIFEQRNKMNFEEKIKSQRIVIAIALILMSLISFNFALKGTYTIIALIVGLVFLGMAFFLLFRLKKA